MNRESAILEMVLRQGQRRGLNRDTISFGQDIAVMSYHQGSSAYRAIELGLDASENPYLRSASCHTSQVA